MLAITSKWKESCVKNGVMSMFAWNCPFVYLFCVIINARGQTEDIVT